ncbi:hypothetical protein EGJ27_02915 [Pseudomonas sp. v388]|uniref:hypothetical protein n=1 Tax=Pseudomonas sp. v388 TaxID=2479849 RepID=UPI000F76B99C|nr:hypothetical protein [Pseudomonas sp. v388]RRV10582.1 hypothetical protein EGJ27_02915 [Pseudomonas sp. v388]
MHPTIPDGRYFVVKGRLWRCSNPALSEDERQRLVRQLMNARRAVKAAKVSGDPDEMKVARASVQAAKVALGERGPVWWDDGAPDLNQHMVRNTFYAEWFKLLDVASDR